MNIKQIVIGFQLQSRSFYTLARFFAGLGRVAAKEGLLDESKTLLKMASGHQLTAELNASAARHFMEAM